MLRKNLTKKFCNFTSVKFQMQKDNQYINNQTDALNQNVYECDEQLSIFKGLSNNTVDKLKQLKGVSNYPVYTDTQFNVYSKLKEISKEANVKQQLRSLIESSIAQAKSLELDKLNLNSFLKNDQYTLEMLYLSNYLNFIQSNKEKDNDTQQLKQINLNTLLQLKEEDVKFVEAVSSGKNYAKYLLNHRADQMTPFKFVELAEQFGKEHNLNVKVFRDDELVQENLNMIYGVGKGSVHRPAMVCLEYKPVSDSNEFISLIGKGVTFDTGGNNIKPTNFIEDMFMDKGGACATFAAFREAVKLGIQKNIVLTVPLAENSCDGKAYRPSDILKSHKGITVEINNTDAEGRLLLADAMSWTQSNYKVTQMIELSTLTGACMVALGTNFAGMFSNSDHMSQTLLYNTGHYGENLWQLPLDQTIKEGLKGGYSDIVNSSRTRYGGAIEAAMFLNYFVDEEVEWVHLDIAGVAQDKKLKNKSNQPLGSGYGVATILDYLR